MKQFLASLALGICCAVASPAARANDTDKETGMIDTMRRPVNGLVTGEMNHLPRFTPTIEVVTATRPGKDKFADRHTPLLKVTTPWNTTDILHIEVPEYVWASVPGDPSHDPFYFGRALTALPGAKVRFPSLETPEWKPRVEGGVTLDNPLEGGYIQHFRVIPHDRYFEVWVGVTNNSEKPLNDLRTQLCLMPHQIANFSERWPTSSKMYSNAQVISWDSAGQDLAWLDKFYDPQTKRFAKSCFFSSPLKGYEPSEFPKRENVREDFMLLARSVDVPAIAKQDPENPQRNLIVYSPYGQDAFYNCLVPCFHSDPHMKSVTPGETRWTVSFFIYYEGNLEDFYRTLATANAKIHTEAGLPVAP